MSFLKKSIKMFALFLLLMDSLAFSETLTAPATFVVHQADMTQWLNEQTAALLVPNQVITPQLNVTSPFQSTITNLLWQGTASLAWTKAATNNVWVFDGQTANLSLQASTFSVHDTIVIQSGGSSLSVRVDAVCQGMSVGFPGSWSVHGELPIAWQNGILQAPLQNFTLTASAQAPVISLQNCQGPSGIQSYLNQALTQLFSNPAGLQTMAAQLLQTYVNSQLSNVQGLLNTPIQFQLLGVNVNFTPTTPSNLSSGSWLMDGTLVLNSALGTGSTTVVKDYTDANLSDVRASGFAFSNALLSQLVAYAFRANLFVNNFTTNDIAAFPAFMQSRFDQFFVWQDLWNFSTSTNFNVAVGVPQAPQIASQTNTFPGVAWSATGLVEAILSAPIKGSFVPYVEFDSTAAANISLNATADSSGNLNVAYSVPSIPLSYGYRKEFFKVRRPSSGIDTNAISSAIQTSLTNQTWSFTMPDAASPFPGDRMIFKDLIFGKKTFRLEMGIVQK